jgi:hypothetical protein
MTKRDFITNARDEELLEHLKDIKFRIETRLVGQNLAELEIDYLQDHTQDTRRDDLKGKIDISAFVHDDILSTDVIFDSLLAALDTRIKALEEKLA